VDLGPASRGPDEHLQGIRAISALVAAGRVPVLGPSRLRQKRKDVRLQERGILRQAGEQRDGFAQCQLRCELGQPLQFARVWFHRERCGLHRLTLLATYCATLA
jgi:hypothetical protein